MATNDPPVACSLDGRTFASRQSHLRASVLGHAYAVERLPEGYRWRFSHDPDLFARLGPLIDSERHCCRFLRFSIVADADMGAITMEITGPAGTAAFLESWIAPASA
jgi:hypothetical protein